MAAMNEVFIPEGAEDEAAMLMGKVNALNSIWKMNKELINADLVSAIFGFEEYSASELEKARAKASKYAEWYKDAEEQLEKLKLEIVKLKLEQKKEIKGME